MTKVSIQNRLMSKVFWVGILSIIALTLKTFGVYTIDDQLISKFVDIIFSALGLLGVYNNPTDKNNW
jgi:uncharacterized membrane protein